MELEHNKISLQINQVIDSKVKFWEATSSENNNNNNNKNKNEVLKGFQVNISPPTEIF